MEPRLSLCTLGSSPAFSRHCQQCLCDGAGEAEACQVAAAQSGRHSSEAAAGQPESLAGCGPPQMPQASRPHASAVKAPAQPQASCLSQVLRLLLSCTLSTGAADEAHARLLEPAYHHLCVLHLYTAYNITGTLHLQVTHRQPRHHRRITPSCNSLSTSACPVSSPDTVSCFFDCKVHCQQHVAEIAMPTKPLQDLECQQKLQNLECQRNHFGNWSARQNHCRKWLPATRCSNWDGGAGGMQHGRSGARPWRGSGSASLASASPSACSSSGTGKALMMMFRSLL